MKPKNQKERRERFLKFLLLFAITVGLIVFAAYFNHKIPTEENRQLRYMAKKSEQELKFQKHFFRDMNKLNGKLDSLSNGLLNGSNKSYVEDMVTKDLGKLLDKVPSKDSTGDYEMYNSIISLYYQYHESQIKVRDLSSAEETINRLNADLAVLREDNDRLRTQLNILPLTN